MLRTLFIVLLSAVTCGPLSAAGKQRFTVTGRVDGLRKGDTLRFERILLPRWDYAPAFDVVVTKPGVFRYKGALEHDQYYMMTYHPESGDLRESDRFGKPLLVSPGDRITLTGTADEIDYGAWGGGLYDESRLAELLRVEDSVSCVRSSYLRRNREALRRNDTVAAQEWARKFNLFYQNNPGYERQRSLSRRYAADHPHGNLYLLVEAIPGITYTPSDEVRATYDTYPEALRASYYGRIYADRMERMERLSPGRPGPDFTVTTVDGRTLTRDDFRGKYLLMYHWSTCPGSIALDRYVCDLYDRYRAQGFEVLGLTESVADIRRVYESLPSDRPTPMVGTDDIRPVLAGMLEHPWPEVEVETDRPENGLLMEDYVIQGFPFFVFLGPDGTILARGFHDAFQEASRLLSREFGAQEQAKQPE